MPARHPGNQGGKKNPSKDFPVPSTHRPSPSGTVVAVGAAESVDPPRGFECRGQEPGLCF